MWDKYGSQDKWQQNQYEDAKQVPSIDFSQTLKIQIPTSISFFILTVLPIVIAILVSRKFYQVFFHRLDRHQNK